jgi:lysyl-tRNA synthetase class 2
MREAIVANWPQPYDPPSGETIDVEWLYNPVNAYKLFTYLLQFTDQFTSADKGRAYQDIPEANYKASSWKFAEETSEGVVGDRSELDANVENLFALLAEPKLIRPTFITDFPKAISPLSKASPSDPAVAERFEYFVAAIESANGFSELNDPEEQYQRFKDQVIQRERGDEEAMVMDEDYIRALSYGMPPAAGIGVGIDRLVMLLANKHSIRDVILFPHLRPEKAEGSKQQAEGKQ